MANNELEDWEKWRCAELKINDALTEHINSGSHWLNIHVDYVESATLYPVKVSEGLLQYSGVVLDAVGVNGRRVPFSFFVPDGTPHGIQPLTPDQTHELRQMASRREVVERT